MMDGLALPAGNKLGPNCGVTCVAILAGVSFDEAWRALAEIAGRKGSWRGGTTVAQRLKALDRFGVRYVDVSPDPARPLPTLKTFARRHRHDRAAVYMVRTSKHVQLVWGDVVIDQSGHCPAVAHWGRNKRVTHVHRIVWGA